MIAQKFTIANIAGGDERTFSLRAGEISGAAIRYAANIGYGGPVFSGPAGDAASILCQQAWDDAEVAAEVAS